MRFNSLDITSLKRKRDERWFVDFKITLMLHCGNEFRMEVCSFCFKFDDMVPRKSKIISSSFLELLNILVLEHKDCLKKFLLKIL